MSVDGFEQRSEKRNFTGVVLAATFAGMLLSGCSSVPDAANPVEWYRGTVDFFTGEEGEEDTGERSAEAQANMESGEAAAKEKDFPNLASVPARPSEGLVGDTSGRRYADAPARRHWQSGIGV